MYISRNLIGEDFEQNSKFETAAGGSRFFWFAKRTFDICMSLALLPLFLASAVFLLVLNLRWNKGSLFYTQQRMGQGCHPFTAIKFRSMTAVDEIARGVNDPIEHDRITALGKFMRRSRVDELPQVLNVLKGDMSLIGPRPDYFEHAQEFYRTIPEYRHRHIVRPGISGLAQVRLGYIEGTEATRNKASMDLEYIRNSGFRQDTGLVFETIRCVVLRSGA